jgi:hypothetical protein
MASGNGKIPESAAHSREDPPPFLTTWKRVYLAVLGYLFFLIAALYAVTVKFRY